MKLAFWIGVTVVACAIYWIGDRVLRMRKARREIRRRRDLWDAWVKVYKAEKEAEEALWI